MENEANWLFGLPVQEVVLLVEIFVIVYLAARLGELAIEKNKLIEYAVLGGVLSLTIVVGTNLFFGMDEFFPGFSDNPILRYAGTFLIGVAAVCLFAVLHKHTKKYTRNASHGDKTK